MGKIKYDINFKISSQELFNIERKLKGEELEKYMDQVRKSHKVFRNKKKFYKGDRNKKGDYE